MYKNIYKKYTTTFSQQLRQFYLRCFALSMGSVQTLRIYGTCPEFITDVVSACPVLESLETDTCKSFEVGF
jgi:hypothetical protein